MKKEYILILLLGTFFFGVGAGYSFGVNNGKKNLKGELGIIHPIRENASSYTFINPLLAYIIPSADQQDDFKLLKNKISSFVDAEKKRGTISDAAVFFSDLNHGRWIGVNENEKYTPASMLKVVIMVAYYKEAEKDKDLLQKKLI